MLTARRVSQAECEGSEYTTLEDASLRETSKLSTDSRRYLQIPAGFSEVILN